MKKDKEVLISTKRERKLERKDSNTCLTDCFAHILKKDAKKVPFFIGMPDWRKGIDEWLNDQGYKVEVMLFDKTKLKPKTLYIIQGLSPRSKVPAGAPFQKRRRALQHAVVYKGNKPFFDPNGGGKFLKGKPMYMWVITKISKREKRMK